VQIVLEKANPTPFLWKGGGGVLTLFFYNFLYFVELFSTKNADE
jgi:hypothetical protein